MSESVADRAAQVPVAAVDAVVYAVVAGFLEAPAVDAAYDLSGRDSIDLVEIADRVEARLRPAHPQVAIDDDALARCATAGDLVALVEASLRDDDGSDQQE